MAITFTCPCGQTLSVDDEHAGKPVRCPSCQQAPIVPGGTSPSGGAQPWAKSDAAAGGPPAQPKPARSLEGGIMNSGVAGGMLAMIGAVVWFVVALAADRIFIYPPILFVIGLIAVFKGLTKGPDQGA